MIERRVEHFDGRTQYDKHEALALEHDVADSEYDTDDEKTYRVGGCAQMLKCTDVST